MTFPKFQACILAEMAFIDELQNQTHQNTKNCELDVAFITNALGVENWTVLKLFIKNDIPVEKWVVSTNTVCNTDPKFFGRLALIAQ